jgi:subtilisin family serine protease
LPELQISRHPAPFDFILYFVKLSSIPKYDPESTDPFQVDLRSQDLTNINMKDSLADLMYASFDSKTKWPALDKMPADFDWKNILETSKDPGLGIRALHQQGITGKGVGIAIIDQTLLVDHIEYQHRIQVYEEMDDVGKDWSASMHGPAVASIAVGKNDELRVLLSKLGVLCFSL